MDFCESFLSMHTFNQSANPISFVVCRVRREQFMRIWVNFTIIFIEVRQ